MGESWCVGRALTAAVLAALAGGCASSRGDRQLSPAMFMPPVGAGASIATAVPVVDDPTPIMPVKAVADPDVGSVDDAAEAEPSPKKAMILTPVQAFDEVKPLSALQPEDGGLPTTMPTTAPSVASTPSAAHEPTPAAASDVSLGVYMTVGGVLAEVNDTPIYANTVLALLDRELSARARDMAPDDFREYAAGRIVQQLHELITDELDYSMAYKALSKEDKQLVDANASATRADIIKRAGGSLELARRRAAEEGYDFEDLLRQEYRHLVISVYQRRQIDPQVQVTADDMRAEYAAHGAKLYGDKDRLLFRVIKIDPARFGGEQPRVAALAKIRAIRQRAAAGQDFAAMASAENDDEGLRSAGGDPGGWMDRGSYRLDAVEAALWQLSPGQVTDVIEVDGAFYVAKLEDKHQGHTKPFDDPTVQDDIYKRLSQQQRVALWGRVGEAAEADAITSTPDPKLTTVLEMVMQKYDRWAGK